MRPSSPIDIFDNQLLEAVRTENAKRYNEKK